MGTGAECRFLIVVHMTVAKALTVGDQVTTFNSEVALKKE